MIHPYFGNFSPSLLLGLDSLQHSGGDQVTISVFCDHRLAIPLVTIALTFLSSPCPGPLNDVKEIVKILTGSSKHGWRSGWEECFCRTESKERPTLVFRGGRGWRWGHTCCARTHSSGIGWTHVCALGSNEPAWSAGNYRKGVLAIEAGKWTSIWNRIRLRKDFVSIVLSLVSCIRIK